MIVNFPVKADEFVGGDIVAVWDDDWMLGPPENPSLLIQFDYDFAATSPYYLGEENMNLWITLENSHEFDAIYVGDATLISLHPLLTVNQSEDDGKTIWENGSRTFKFTIDIGEGGQVNHLYEDAFQIALENMEQPVGIAISNQYFSFDIYITSKSDESWPMFFLDPQHTGNTTSTAPDTNDVLWNLPNMGGSGDYGWSSPVVSKGRVFLNKGIDGILYCLSENNGKEIWNSSIESNGYECSTPAIADGLVYVVGDKLYCFYESNGTEVWSKPVSGAGTGTSSPTVVNGRVYLNTETIYCFYANNGTTIWSRTGGGNGESTPAVANGMVFVNGQLGLDPSILCLDAENGDEIWNMTATWCSTSPATANGRVFFNTGDSEPIKCLYADNGTEIWSKPDGGDDFSSPAVANGKVFVNNNGLISCYYEANGTEAWQTAIAGSGCSTPAVSSDGKVFLVGGGNIYCLNENNGSEIWSYFTGGPGWSSPTIANNKVFVNQGTIYCFGPNVEYILIRDAPNGKGKWVGNRTFSVCETENFYAAAYNNSAPGEGYLGDVEVEWECSNILIGNVSSFGTSTLFTAQSMAGECYVTARYGSLNSNTTGILTVLPATVDYIIIRNAPNNAGNEVLDRTYNVGDIDYFWAAGYNNTVAYVNDVVVLWESSNPGNGQVIEGPSNTTTFYANATHGGNLVVTATSSDPSIQSGSTGLLTVLEWKLDFIIIRDAPNGGGNIVQNRIYNVGESEVFYAAGYNKTADYLGDVNVLWYSDNLSIGSVSPFDSNSTKFQAKLVGGTCNITARYSSEISNITGVLTVLPPTVDYIRILDEGNNVLEAITLDWGDWIHCHTFGYNETVGPLGNVEVLWSLEDEIGTLVPDQDYYTNLTVTIEGSTVLTATYDSIVTNSTQVIVNPRISAPTGLSVIPLAQGNTLNISWNPNPEENLAGYNIHCSLSFDGDYSKINTELIMNEYYVDEQLTNGIRYYYYVVAIDTSQRSSEPSEEESGIPDFDTDGDGLFNHEDEDDDNDGLPDSKEDKNGNGIVDPGETNPLDPDSDDDGHLDGEDHYPLNPKKWEKTKEGIPIILLLILIIVVILVMILLYILLNKHKSKQMFQPFEDINESSPPPSWFKFEEDFSSPSEEDVPHPSEDELPPSDE